ncbi:hypothetical protein GCM10017714_15790 [Curtobacterium pusillum]|nr:hypothetical protein GCM10017610_11240 [Curtobacterium pusillum]
MGSSMGESYRVDRGASEQTVAHVRAAASDVAEHAASLSAALEALAAAADGSPDVAAALTSFGEACAGTAAKVGTPKSRSGRAT